MNNKYLIVLPYKQGGSQGKEIELCLYGWRKFCQFDYEFVVIGEFSDNLKDKFDWVRWIYKPCLKKRLYNYNQHLDVQNCEEIVKQIYSGKYDGFIWIADDNYAIKPFYPEDILQIHYHSESFEGVKEFPCNFWKHDKWKTRQLLDNEGLPHINYTTHYPCYLEFSKLSEIWDKFDMRNESYVLEDVYFNYFEHQKPILDSEIRLGIWNYSIFTDELPKALKDPKIKFLCNSVEGWSEDLEKVLEGIVK